MAKAKKKMKTKVKAKARGKAKKSRKTAARSKAKARPKPKGRAKARKAPAPAAEAEAHAAALPWREPIAGEIKLGIVEDYYGHINVIALVLEQPLAVGEHIHVRGHTTDLSQAVESMQIGHQSVSQANPGDAVGIKVNDKCRKGDYVYKAPSA